MAKSRLRTSAWLIDRIVARRRAVEAERFFARVSEVLAATLDYRITVESLARPCLDFLADGSATRAQGGRGWASR